MATIPEATILTNNPAYTIAHIYYAYLNDFKLFRVKSDSDFKKLCRQFLKQELQNLSKSQEPIKICYSANGKPFIKDSTLQFSVTNTKDCISFAIGNYNIGIDLEKSDREVDYNKLASFLYSPEEIEWFSRLNNREKKTAFLTSWTRKEALIKAMSGRLTLPINEITIDQPQLINTKLKEISWSEREKEHWKFYGINSINGYICNLASTNQQLELKVKRLMPEDLFQLKQTQPDAIYT